MQEHAAMTGTAQLRTEQQIARLERLRNRKTRHELAAINGDRKILVCYASTTSRRGILAALKGREARVDALVKLTGETTASRGPHARPTTAGWTTGLSASLDAPSATRS